MEKYYDGRMIEPRDLKMIRKFMHIDSIYHKFMLIEILCR